MWMGRGDGFYGGCFYLLLIEISIEQLVLKAFGIVWLMTQWRMLCPQAEMVEKNVPSTCSHLEGKFLLLKYFKTFIPTLVRFFVFIRCLTFYIFRLRSQKFFLLRCGFLVMRGKRSEVNDNREICFSSWWKNSKFEQTCKFLEILAGEMSCAAGSRLRDCEGLNLIMNF